MRHLFRFLILATLSLAAATSALADSLCAELLRRSETQLITRGQEHRSVESAAAVRRMREKLEEISASLEHDELGRVYAALKPKLDETRALGARVEAEGYPQGLVAKFAQDFSMVVEFPVKYLNELARYASGDTRDSVYDFDPAYHQEVVLEYNGRRTRAAEDFLLAYSRSYAKYLEGQRPLLNEKFEYTQLRGTNRKEYEADHFFQYKYVYLIGESRMMDFVMTRETGVVFIGVKLGMRGDYDGQYGTNSAFGRHDHIHARAQKVKDQQLFDAFGISSIEAANKLKESNHAEVRALIAEWESIPDPRLKAAVEATLFALMHEQATSYPTQVTRELGDAETVAFYKRALKSGLRSGRFGRRVPKLLEGAEEQLLSEAFAWILARSTPAAERVWRAHFPHKS